MTQPLEKPAKGILPYNKVVTVIETKAELDQAVTALTATGIAEADILIHHGKQAENYFDLDGSESGFIRNLVRRYQRLQGIEKKMFNDVEAGIEGGHYMIGVDTHGHEEQQITIRDALSPSTRHHIYYCSRFTISILTFAHD